MAGQRRHPTRENRAQINHQPILMNFDKTFPLIYCLNLAKRQDRRVRCEEIFEMHGLRVWRFPAVDAGRVKRLHGFENAGRYAHSISTRLIIRRAMQAKAPAVFIFEDDVVLAEDWRKRLAVFDLPEDWGMFYLGCQHQMRPQVVGPGLVRVRGALDTHAWGIRASHYRQALRVLAGRNDAQPSLLPPADLLLARQQQKDDGFAAYAVFPNLAWQEEEHSDLVNGIFSNYDSDGWQRPARNVIVGVCAEALGGRAWPAAVTEARKVVPFYEQRWERPVLQLTEEAPAPKMVLPILTPPVKLAFLFLTRADTYHAEIWQEYFAQSTQGDFSLHAHAADVSAVRSELLRTSQITERIEPTAWGNISLVRAMLELLRAGLTDERNTHFVFLSESCVPIRPLADLRRVLALDGRSRFHWQPYEEVAEKHSDKAARMEKVRGVPRGLGRFHSQWLLLNREATELVAEDDFTGHFAEAWAPDEFYFGTVLEMKGWPLSDKVARDDVTWTDWVHGGPHPRTHTSGTHELAAKLAASGKFFARKFAPGCGIKEYELHRTL